MTPAQTKYALRIGEATDDGHNHVHVVIPGWKCSFDVKGDEYFQLSGIAKVDRVQRLVDAANRACPDITASLIRNILAGLRNIDFGDADGNVLDRSSWNRFATDPARIFPRLSDDQQDAIAEVINARLARGLDNGAAEIAEARA
jgi:hypothetical protein